MPQHAIVTDDPRLNYMVVTPEPEADVPEGCCGLCPNTTITNIDKYDYYVPLPKDESVHKEPLPMSFLQIKEGDVEGGIQWYRQHYPKLPDELVEIMARYNFGDLKYATRKSIRNNTKKYKKKHKESPPLCKGLMTNKGKHIVTFD
eukprot:SAG11_NODE_2821_length_2939_cov_35.977113_2_plen_146_part_00